MDSKLKRSAADRADRRWGKTSAQSRPDMDRLVATYAMMGRKRRRARIHKGLKFGGLGLGLAMVAALVLLYLGDRLPLPNEAAIAERAALGQQLQDTRELRSLLAEETEAVRRQRAELVAQRQSLSADLSALNEQRAELEARRAAADNQREQLAAEIAVVEAEQRRLAAQRNTVATDLPELERSMAQVEAQRQELELQRSRFREQRDALAAEIRYLTSQREELETQREQLETQWLELQILMEQVNEATQPGTSGEPTSSVEHQSSLDGEPQAGDSFVEDTPPYIGSLAAVADEQLSKMRAGIAFGDELNIAIGLTRTASVNGIEQYASSLRIDDLTAVNMAELGNIGTVLIQNGAGNSVSPATLDSLSNGLATIIQNTLDNQNIATTNVFDVSVGNTATAISGNTAVSAITDTLSLQP
ncbi:MAG: hypothetical protein QNJ73_08235 [Gammaproteobacteria bacterium]|nr:hypothetical protein [Gammaproteobacteria bacterium]